jgi:ArsR family transcriptional regulator
VTTELPILPAGPSADACCAPAAGLARDLDADRIAAIAKALAEPLRVRILDVVRRSEEPVCQCELIALFDIKQSLLSHHVKKLVESGLMTVERRHRWAYYSPADGAAEELTTWLT